MRVASHWGMRPAPIPKKRMLVRAPRSLQLQGGVALLTSLDHEPLDVPVEYDTVIIVAGAQREEVFRSLGSLQTTQPYQQYSADTRVAKLNTRCCLLASCNA